MIRIFRELLFSSYCSLGWMGSLLCDPGRGLPRASQTTRVSSILSWDEISDWSQVP